MITLSNAYQPRNFGFPKFVLARSKYERTRPKPKFLSPKADLSQVNPVFLYFSESLTRMLDAKQYDLIWTRWAKFKRIHKGNAVIWGQMLEVCAATGDVENAITLFNEMQQLGIAYDEHCVRAMILLLLNQNYYDHATFLIQKFIDADDQTVLTSPYFWNVIFKFYVRTGRLNELKLTTSHFLHMFRTLQKYQRPRELAPLMRQYRTSLPGTKEQKRRLFDLVEQSLLLDSDYEIQMWRQILKDCGYQYDFPSTSAAVTHAKKLSKMSISVNSE